MTIRRGSTLEYVLIFLAGSAWDALASLDTIFTSHFSVSWVFFSSVALTLLGYSIFDRIIEDAKVSWPKVWALSLGSGLGAAITSGLLGGFY